MNLKQLRLVREIVRANFNVTEAASSIYTSQSGVSKHIKDLEDELGVTLFRRRGRRLLGLTEPGAQVLRLVEKVLFETDNIRRIANTLSNERSGTLTIATTHTQSRYALPRIFSEFRHEYPDVDIVLKQAQSGDVPDLLLRGDADIGLATDTLMNVPELLAFASYQWEHCVVVPEGHALLTRKDVKIADVVAYPLVTYGKDLTGRRQIDQAFASAGLKPKIALTAIDSDVIKTYVELGFGVGIIASMAFDQTRDRKLRRVKTGKLFKPSTTSIAIRSGRFLKGFAYRFIELSAPGVTRETIDAADEAASLIIDASGADKIICTDADDEVHD